MEKNHLPECRRRLSVHGLALFVDAENYALPGIPDFNLLRASLEGAFERNCVLARFYQKRDASSVRRQQRDKLRLLHESAKGAGLFAVYTDGNSDPWMVEDIRGNSDRYDVVVVISGDKRCFVEPLAELGQKWGKNSLLLAPAARLGKPLQGEASRYVRYESLHDYLLQTAYRG